MEELERRAGKGHSQGKPIAVFLDPGGILAHGSLFFVFFFLSMLNVG